MNGKRSSTKTKEQVDQEMRPTDLYGSRQDNSGLKVVSPKNLVWLFISRLSTDTIPEEIIIYVSLNWSVLCECEKLTIISRNKYSSFKLGIPMDKKMEALHAAFRPDGIIINKFSNLRNLVSIKAQT